MGTTPGSPFPSGSKLVTRPSSQSCQGITHPAAWSPSLQHYHPWGKKNHKTQMFESQTKGGWVGLGEAVLTNPPLQQASMAPNLYWRKQIWMCWSSGWWWKVLLVQKHLNSDPGPPCHNCMPGVGLAGFTQRHHKIDDKNQTSDISLLLLHLTKESWIPWGRNN